MTALAFTVALAVLLATRKRFWRYAALFQNPQQSKHL